MLVKPETPPVVIVHSAVPEDALWADKLATALKGLGIPFWAGYEGGDVKEKRLCELLDHALVVLPLVSVNLMAPNDPDQDPRHHPCDLVRERLRSPRGGHELVVLPLLVRSCDFEHALLDEIKPINTRALASLEPDEADRGLAETARRVQRSLKGVMRLEIRDVLNKRPRNVAEHIQRAVCLLDQAGAYLEAALSDVADLAAYLLQELLGSGARMPSKQDDPALIERVLGRLVKLCPKENALSELKDETYRQLYTVIRSLEALRPAAPTKDLRAPPDLNAAQELLPLWIRAVEQHSEGKLWEDARTASLDLLPGYFASKRGWGIGEQRPLPQVRIFHCIWFCTLVLKQFPPAASQVRTDLAYVFREALRFLCFGYEDNEEQRRPYYYFDTMRYTSALRTVVTYHATQVLGQPFEHVIGSFLATVASTRGVNQYSPAEHLQHILEIYMAGNFILRVRIRGRYDGLTLAEVLRGNKRDDQLILECEQAFILAALFHDSGHLVLPRIRSDMEEFGLQLSPLRQELRELASGLRDSINRFAAPCVERLAKYAEATEGTSDNEMPEWLQEQRGRPGHGLFSAWYLLDVCDNRGLKEWVLRSAIRAVLLHNALKLRLFAESDPIAALLVLCDEVFEWDPSHPTTASSAGKSLHVIAPEVPAHEPLDRWIRVDQIRLDDEFQASLRSGVEDLEWPTIHIELQGPQRLPMPIYQLWFRKSQNLGRIVRARCGFGPVLMMTSAFLCEGDTNRARIDAHRTLLPDDLKSTLDDWLDATRIEVRDRQETIHLRPFEAHPGLYKKLPQLVEHIRQQERKALVRED